MISLWCSAYSRQSASYLWLAKGFHFSQFWQCHADSLGYFSGLGIYPADSVSWSCSGSYRYGGGSIDVVVNLGTALLFLKNSQHDLNIRGAFLHMAADAAVSDGVVIASALYL